MSLLRFVPTMRSLIVESSICDCDEEVLSVFQLSFPMSAIFNVANEFVIGNESVFHCTRDRLFFWLLWFLSGNLHEPVVFMANTQFCYFSFFEDCFFFKPECFENGVNLHQQFPLVWLIRGQALFVVAPVCFGILFRLFPMSAVFSGVEFSVGFFQVSRKKVFEFFSVFFRCQRFFPVDNELFIGNDKAVFHFTLTFYFSSFYFIIYTGIFFLPTGTPAYSA